VRKNSYLKNEEADYSEADFLLALPRCLQGAIKDEGCLEEKYIKDPIAFLILLSKVLGIHSLLLHRELGIERSENDSHKNRDLES